MTLLLPYYTSHYYSVIITHYYICYYYILLQVYYYVLLHHFTSFLSHYYTILTSLLQMGNHEIMIPLLPVMQRGCLYYYVLYHHHHYHNGFYYYSLLHITVSRTCRDSSRTVVVIKLLRTSKKKMSLRASRRVISPRRNVTVLTADSDVMISVTARRWARVGWGLISRAGSRRRQRRWRHDDTITRQHINDMM